MKSRKLNNPDGSTRKIVVKHPSGMYSSYTPIEAARMINELTAQLWAGIPINSGFRRASV